VSFESCGERVVERVVKSCSVYVCMYVDGRERAVV